MTDQETKHPGDDRIVKSLQIISQTDHYVVVNKPNKISSWDVLEYLFGRSILGDKKPGLVYDLPYNIGGLLLIPRTPSDTCELRNSYGSDRFKFGFELLSTSTKLEKKSPIICKLPIAKHKTKNLHLISHTTGKKAQTKFKFIESIGRFEHWSAICSYLRDEQISLHAYEMGINILGDEKYACCPVPSFRELKRNFKDNRKENNKFPYYGPAIYLNMLELPDGQKIQINLSKKLSVFMKLLAFS